MTKNKKDTMDLVYELEEDGRWLVSVDSVPGAMAYGAMAHLLEAGELLRLNGTLLDVLKRRGRGGYISWHMASGADERDEADRCGRRFTLREALKALGLELRKVEVRP